MVASENTTVDINGTPYCYESMQLKFLEDLSGRVKNMRRAGRLTPEVLGNLRKYFRIKSIYHSNAIEGNVLDVGETRQVVEYGLTITGKPLKDQAEAKNLKEAIDFLEELACTPDKSITESDIRQIHYLVLKGIDDSNAGKYREIAVEISGSDYKPPPPESVPPQMHDFSTWLSGVSCVNGKVGDPEAIIYAAVAHTWFVYIHPFIDGNGRVARLLMNLILMRYGYPIAIITKEDRLRYYDALEISQTADLSPFISLVTECIEESLDEYEQAAQEQLQQQEWAAALASKFTEKEKIRARNQYEVWRSAMDLLKSYFRQSAELLDENAELGRVYFKDFGELEFEKYLSLKTGGSAKRTWFFRIDFVSGDKAARYLFFFGSPSYAMRSSTDVTIHIAREEPPKSFHYEKLEHINAPNVPGILEIGYRADAERFIVRPKAGQPRMDKVEHIGKSFFNQVVSMHFQS